MLVCGYYHWGGRGMNLTILWGYGCDSFIGCYSGQAGRQSEE